MAAEWVAVARCALAEGTRGRKERCLVVLVVCGSCVVSDFTAAHKKIDIFGAKFGVLRYVQYSVSEQDILVGDGDLTHLM